MQHFEFDNLTEGQLVQLVQRPATKRSDLSVVVADIIANVKSNGQQAIERYCQQFDSQPFQVKAVPSMQQLAPQVPTNIRDAISVATQNISKFHQSQLLVEPQVATMPGVTCYRQNRAIERVGIYIPGGSYPLISTVMMLAIPAKIAGCEQIVVCSPAQLNATMLYTARVCGIETIYNVGGAHAIAAMAFGTERIPKVDKIFGPGNDYVTEAKQQVSQSLTAIDMPAGPSEVLIIADTSANPDFVAADFLAQLEHGSNSQAVLVALNQQFVVKVVASLQKQLQTLNNRAIIEQSLQHSYSIVCPDLQTCMQFANQYAAEHLILNVANPQQWQQSVINAGSVFLGQYSCEVAGDYASGTNHTLPTYGYARNYSGVSVDSFVKKITFQSMTAKGVANLAPTVECLAQCEGLDAHQNAMQIRRQCIEQQCKS